MPSNKNALLRYKCLDEMLSGTRHLYDIHTLTERVNERLTKDSYSAVSKRCVEKDLQAIEELFGAPVTRERRNGKSYIKYEIPSFSIFAKEMSDEERMLLREVLNTMGQFEGLDHFTWLSDLKRKLNYNPRNEKAIISFSTNSDLKNSGLLGQVFDEISNRQTVCLAYQKFNDMEKHEIVVYPYQLKQYNDRWFLICSPEYNTDIVLNFALDRIDSATPLKEKPYHECTVDLEDYYWDIVGVTRYANKPVERVIFWVSKEEYSYVETKPIHPSQKIIPYKKEKELQEKYDLPADGKFFEIDCMENYELIRELTSYGSGLLVLSPQIIQDKVCTRIAEMKAAYDKIKNLSESEN